MAAIRVLVIEGEPTLARLLERMLELAPIAFRVTVADTLRQAQELLSNKPFNLILTVLDLPDEKGLRTLEVLRSTESTLPIVVLTGRVGPDLELRAISLGAQFCLPKSEVNTQSLLNAMLRAVRDSRPRSPSISDDDAARLLGELEESIVAIKEALAILDIVRDDSPQQDAVHAIRSHIGTMQKKIGTYRRPERRLS